MLNIGAGEIGLIVVVALLLLGPRRLPELARGIGKFLREFRRQTDDVRSTLETEFYRMDQDIARDQPKSPLAGVTTAALTPLVRPDPLTANAAPAPPGEATPPGEPAEPLPEYGDGTGDDAHLTHPDNVVDDDAVAAALGSDHAAFTPGVAPGAEPARQDEPAEPAPAAGDAERAR